MPESVITPDLAAADESRGDAGRSSGGGTGDEHVCATIVWGALLRLARLARNRLAARYLKETGEQRTDDRAIPSDTPPEDVWRMALLQVHRRSLATIPVEALEEPRFEAFARLCAIGLFLNIPRSPLGSQGGDIAEFNECIAQMAREHDRAGEYLPGPAVVRLGQLLTLLPPLPAMPTKAQLIRVLGDAYVDGFDRAFAGFISSPDTKPGEPRTGPRPTES